jgi:thymidylate kinase
MIIEFIGGPGAGKTTLLPAVIEYLQQSDITGLSVVDAARPYAERTLVGKTVNFLAPGSLRRPLLWQVFYYYSLLYRLRFFAKHPKLIRQVSSTQKRRPIPARERQPILYWFFHTTGYYEFLSAHLRPNEALIFDEGFIHRVVQMNVSDIEMPNPDQVLAYVDLLPQPDLVIFVQSSPETCVNRIYSRGLRGRLLDKSREQITQFVANAHRVVNLAVEHAKTKGWNIIEVDNDRTDLTTSKAELGRQLMANPALNLGNHEPYRIL